MKVHASEKKNCLLESHLMDILILAMWDAVQKKNNPGIKYLLFKRIGQIKQTSF
jgi:hypothetical protein